MDHKCSLTSQNQAQCAFFAVQGCMLVSYGALAPKSPQSTSCPPRPPPPARPGQRTTRSPAPAAPGERVARAQNAPGFAENDLHSDTAFSLAAARPRPAAPFSSGSRRPSEIAQAKSCLGGCRAWLGQVLSRTMAPVRARPRRAPRGNNCLRAPRAPPSGQAGCSQVRGPRFPDMWQSSRSALRHPRPCPGITASDCG